MRHGHEPRGWLELGAWIGQAYGGPFRVHWTTRDLTFRRGQLDVGGLHSKLQLGIVVGDVDIGSLHYLHLPLRSRDNHRTVELLLSNCP
nr:hypothetical protein CFP56_41377 [Quercus suber]